MNILTSWIFRQNPALIPLAPPILVGAFVQGANSIEITYFAPIGVPGIFIERSEDGGTSWTVLAAVPRDDSGTFGPPGICIYLDQTVQTDIEYLYRAQSYSGALRSIYVQTPAGIYASKSDAGIIVWVDDLDPSAVIVEFSEPMFMFSGTDATQYSIYGKTITAAGWTDNTHLSLTLSAPVVAAETLLDFEYRQKIGSGIKFTDPSGPLLSNFTARTNNLMVWTPVGVPFTVGAGGDYADITAAFADINAGNITGDIELELTASTVLAASAELNCSGEGAANYTSVTVYPSSPGIVISYAVPGVPVMNIGAAGASLNGVIIDGRVNRRGSPSLEIRSSAGPAFMAGLCGPGTSVNHCKFVTLATNTTVVMIFSLDPTVAFANNELNISEGQARTGLYAEAASILCNRISGAFSPAPQATTYGIQTGGDAAVLVYGNSIFGPVTPLSNYGGKFIAISMEGTATIAQHNVRRNYIGGTAPYCAGAPLSNADVVNLPTPDRNHFIGIYLNNQTSNGIPVSVAYNTIANIDWNLFTDSTFAEVGPYFYGIYADNAYDANSSTMIEYNTIGDMSSVGSIVVHGRAPGEEANIKAIYWNAWGSSGFATYNSIGSIQASNILANCPTHITCIHFPDVGEVCSSLNNTIGGAIEHSIESLGNSTKYVVGIEMGTFNSLVNASTNTIRNLTNRSTAGGTPTCTIGIKLWKGTTSTNTIYNLTGYSRIASLDEYPSVAGIVRRDNFADTANCNSNTIYSLSNLNMIGSYNVVGIYHQGRTSASVNNALNLNFIYSLYGAAPTGSIYGIKIGPGSTRCSNNIIALGSSNPAAIYGIHDEADGANNVKHIAFNTVLVAGDGVAGVPSMCLYSNAGTNTWVYKDNLLINTRTTPLASNLHYALWLEGNPTNPGTADWNNLVASGVGGTLARYDGTNYSALPIGGPGTGHDNNTSIPVTFRSNLTGANAYRLASASIPGNNTTVNITSDYTPQTRTVPNMGAFEAQMLPMTQLGTQPVDADTIRITYTTADPDADMVSIERRVYNVNPYVEVGQWFTAIGTTQWDDDTAVSGVVYQYRTRDLDSGGLIGGYTSPVVSSIGGLPQQFLAGIAGINTQNVQDFTKAWVAVNGPSFKAIAPLPAINTAWLSMAGKVISSAQYIDGNLEITVTVPFVQGDEIPDLVYTQPAPASGLEFQVSGVGGLTNKAYVASFTQQMSNYYPIVSAVVENAAPSNMVVTFGPALSEAVADVPVANDGHFYPFINGNPVATSNITVVGNVVTITLLNPIVAGDSLAISYAGALNAAGDLRYLVSTRTVPSSQQFPVTNNVV